MAVRRPHPARRGFTLVELAVTMAMVGILGALAVYGLGSALRSSRISGARFELVRAFEQARQRAASQNTDVYLVFSHLESTSAFPLSDVPRVLVYEDRTRALRSTAAQDAIMATVDANPKGVRFELNGLSASYGMSGLTFLPRDGTQVAPCPAAVPGYLGITANRAARSADSCAKALCSFCEDQAGRCVGALRFTPDGMVRAVTGPAGSGGVLKMVNLDSDARSLCLAFSEPAGVVVSF